MPGNAIGQRLTICPGGANVSFAYSETGGLVEPGQNTLLRDGYPFLVVDGSCRYWVQSGKPWEIRTGRLSEDEGIAILNDFQVAAWSTVNGACGAAIADGSTIHLRFGFQRLTVDPGCGEDSVKGASAPWLRKAIADHLQRAYDGGAEVDGPVRYVLTPPGAPWGASVSKTAVSWPLASKPSDVAVPFATFAYGGASLRLAEGADAVALRELRFDAAATTDGEGIPVKDDAGALYDLFARDTMPLEDADGRMNLF